MAALRRPARVLGSALLLTTLCLAPAAASAADPTPPPIGSSRATCADRFFPEGPAGVDLRLGCIVGELVGLYTASAAADPAPISFYFIGLFGAISAVLLAVWLTMRVLFRRAGRRLAPVLPGTWWVCDRCRSVNAADAGRCYACGGPPSRGRTLATAEDPAVTQSFGSTRKRG